MKDEQIWFNENVIVLYAKIDFVLLTCELE